MVETPKHQSLSSRWWWLDSPSSIQHKRSPWLQSAIAELDEKTKAMLNLIEEDADSFAQRAEMYYKKRPELITMVEDFYRAHKSLAERCDQLKSESRLSTPRSLSLMPMSKCQPEKLLMGLRSSQKDYDSYSETYELDDSDVEDPYETITATPFIAEEIKTKWVPFNLGSSDLKRFNEEEIDECVESDVEDPEREEEDDGATNERMDELMKLKAEMDRLKEENMTQEEKIMQKDEEKREVIRQLSIAIDMLREENVKLKQRLAAANKDSTPNKNNTRGIEINKLKNSFWGRIFN